MEAISREKYVQHVAEYLGFHTPPVYVRAMIEQLYNDRYSIYGASEWMRGYLAVDRASKP